MAKLFEPFRKSLSGGVKWANKTEAHREAMRKQAKAAATRQQTCEPSKRQQRRDKRGVS